MTSEESVFVSSWHPSRLGDEGTFPNLLQKFAVFPKSFLHGGHKLEVGIEETLGFVGYGG